MGVKLRMRKSRLLARKIGTIRMISGPKPVEAAALLIHDLFEKSSGHRYGLTEADFQCILEQGAGKSAPAGAPPPKARLWGRLKLGGAALARAPAAGQAAARPVCLTHPSGKLFDS